MSIMASGRRPRKGALRINPPVPASGSVVRLVHHAVVTTNPIDDQVN
ncbi:hypothetical protein POX_b03474 [Penicillium oxalicum]|nr:hypothetical protein POX_b03474 [Penicillium oxalicum]KAI2793419.1 hypothetical protein POX_b03474 [Penicillium oxalicum]